MIGGKSIMFPKFMAKFLMESHMITKNLKDSLNKMNVNYFENLEFYKESRLRIEDKIVREQIRYESDLRDVLDVASDCPNSEVAVYRQSECDWLILDTVQCNIEPTGVNETLPNEKMEDGIEVNKDATLYENFDNDANADEFSVDDNVNYLLTQRQVITKILLEEKESAARESPGVTGDVVEVDDCERIERCITIQNTKMLQSKKNLYSLMATNMDADNPSEYCYRL